MSEEGVEHRYPPRSIAADLVRAGGGGLVTGGPLVAFDVVTWLAWILAALTTLFVIFGLLTLYRARMTIRSDADGVTLSGLRRVAIPWADLIGLKLEYYTVGTKEHQGWMQLTLKGSKGRIKMDSRIHGFDGLVRQALEHAHARQLALDPTTLANMRVLGLNPSRYYEDAPDGRGEPKDTSQ